MPTVVFPSNVVGLSVQQKGGNKEMPVGRLDPPSSSLHWRWPAAHALLTRTNPNVSGIRAKSSVRGWRAGSHQIEYRGVAEGAPRSGLYALHGVGWGLILAVVLENVVVRYPRGVPIALVGNS